MRPASTRTLGGPANRSEPLCVPWQYREPLDVGASTLRGLFGLIATLGLTGSVVTEPVEPLRPDVELGTHTAPVVTGERPWSDAWLLASTSTYLDDAQARRTALEASLANPDNLYSQMRISAYGLGRSGWDVLPAWNPRSRPLNSEDVAALRAGRAVEVGAARKLWSGERPSTMQGWTELGRAVFFWYPLRPEVSAEYAFETGAATALGLERDVDGSVPGLVAYIDVDASEQVGITCALCHSAMTDGELVVGRARRTLDFGAMRLAYEHSVGDVDPRLAMRMSSWGPVGRTSPRTTTRIRWPSPICGASASFGI